jgi:hypothetical protein
MDQMTVSSNETEDVLRTMYHHSHNADGTLLADHCCGCWNVVYDAVGLFLRCNECDEKRDLLGLVDPEAASIPAAAQ